MKFGMDKIWLTIVVSWWVILLAGLVYYSGPHITNPIIIGLIIFFIFEILEVLLGTNLMLTDKEFFRTDYFIRKRKISLQNITGLRYASTWKLGQHHLRSLVIDGIVNGQPKLIDMPNNGFAEKNLAAIATELKRRSPSIKVDKHVEELIKKYS